jgi:hypothetical protein
LVRDFTVTRGAVELMHDLAVPMKLEPLEPVDNRVNRGLGRSLAIGVLDTQQHAPAVFSCVEPIEQSGPRAADVEETGWRGGEACNDVLRHLLGTGRLEKQKALYGLAVLARFRVACVQWLFTPSLLRGPWRIQPPILWRNICRWQGI